MEVERIAGEPDQPSSDLLFGDTLQEEIHLPKLNDIEISEEEDNEYLGQITSTEALQFRSIPFYLSVCKMMHAAGDFESPNHKSVMLVLDFIRQLVKVVLSDEVLTKVVKLFNPDLQKKVKFFKLLKVLRRVFELETCTYFSSIEIKVRCSDPEKPQSRRKEQLRRKAKKEILQKPDLPNRKQHEAAEVRQDQEAQSEESRRG